MAHSFSLSLSLSGFVLKEHSLSLSLYLCLKGLAEEKERESLVFWTRAEDKAIQTVTWNIFFLFSFFF